MGVEKAKPHQAIEIKFNTVSARKVACENIRFSSLFAAQHSRARRNGCFRRLQENLRSLQIPIKENEIYLSVVICMITDSVQNQNVVMQVAIYLVGNQKWVPGWSMMVSQKMILFTLYLLLAVFRIFLLVSSADVSQLTN